MDRSDRYIELAALEKLCNAKESQKLANELLFLYSDGIHWMIRYCEKYNIPLPNKESINKIVGTALKLNDDFNRKFTEDSIPRRLYRARKICKDYGKN